MGSKSPTRRAARPAPKAREKKHAAGIRSKRSLADVPTTTKLAALVAVLSTPKGATLSELMALTGWQAHSVRGALSGAVKKQLGYSVVSKKVGTERVYSIGNRK